MRLRIILSNANGTPLDTRDVVDGEDAVEVAQDMLDELGHLSPGDQFTVLDAETFD